MLSLDYNKERFSMAVPQAIREVKRPLNTIVEDSGRDSAFRYSVRERGEIVYESGRNPRPMNGKVIGHIINGEYVPKAEKTKTEPEELSYGACALIQKEAADIYKDLLSVYPAKDATTIMAIAMLRVIKPHIASNRYSTEYTRTFTKIFYPGCALSKNSVTDFLKRIGMDTYKRLEFFSKRIAQVSPSHRLAIDGTLKEDNSRVNDFSAYSRKSRLKGVKDISVMYAFDTESKEPVCSEVFPGNNLDSTAVSSFIKMNNISKGILVADKRFALKNIEDDLKTNKDLHFILPQKRDASVVKNNDGYSYDTVFHYGSKTIQGKKVKLKNGRFLYSFKDVYRAGKEEKNFVDQAIKNGNYDQKTYEEKKEQFGTIVFISDLDLTLEEVYKIYEERWLLELMFAQYKGDIGLTTTNVQGDFAVRGSEFVNFIATVLTSRITKKAEECGALDELTYGDMMDDLSSVWRNIKGNTEKPKLNDGYWRCNTLPSIFKLMVTLGLAVDPTVKRSVGRPKKEKPADDQPKKKRGRPPKKKA